MHTDLSRLVLILAFCVGAGIPAANAQDAPASAPATPPSCTHCRARLKTLDALRAALPADWRLQTEREPVWGSEVLVVEAGLMNPQTLVLVHGLGQNGFTDWLGVMPQLATRYHVLTLDLPGFGYSASPAGKYSPQNYARVLSWLLSHHARGPAIVVGHSMGGAVALRLASAYPAQLSKLILVDAAGILQRTAFVKHSVDARLGGDQPQGLLTGVLARARDIGNATLERVLTLPDPTRVLSGNEGIWGRVLDDRTNANAGMALVEEDFTPAIYTLQTPTHLIWGEADPIAPLRTGQMLAWRLPHAQLQILPGVGHTPMEDGSLEVFAQALDLALDTDPHPLRPREASVAPKPDLLCNGETGRVYSGHYREVRIEDCTAVRLQDLDAEHIVIRDSIAQMLRVRVHGKDTALEVSNSELIATAGELSATTAIHADKSRLDLAGFRLDAAGDAIEVERASRLIASACVIRSPTYSGYWQGSQELETGILVP